LHAHIKADLYFILSFVWDTLILSIKMTKWV